MIQVGVVVLDVMEGETEVCDGRFLEGFLPQISISLLGSWVKL